MNEHNPYLSAPLPSASQVRELVQEALTDWTVRASLPHLLMDGKGQTFEVRQREMFYIQRAVDMILHEQADNIDHFIKRYLGEDNETH